MRILYIGDFIKKNGPSTVDIKYKKYLSINTEADTSFIQSTDYLKFFKIILSINKYDKIVISGVSIFGAFLSLIANYFFSKNIYYICHGLLKYESLFTKVPKKRFVFEKLIINNSKYIFTVSVLLKEKLLDLYKIDSSKIKIQYNGVEFEEENKEYKKNKYTLISVGGGRKQKNILNICKAIELSQYRNKITFFVVGEDGEDSEKIKKFKFVHYLGFISKEDLIDLYKKSEIFLLLSTFDSFPSAFFEAIQNKCSVITSENIGALELFPLEMRNHIISDGNNIELIAKKIDEIFEKPNIDRVYKYVLNNYEEFSWKNRSNCLISELKE
jgi:glycosyltransferase involved in cell wall biosynthesis